MKKVIIICYISVQTVKNKNLNLIKNQEKNPKKLINVAMNSQNKRLNLMKYQYQKNSFDFNLNLQK